MEKEGEERYLGRGGRGGEVNKEMVVVYEVFYNVRLR